MSTAGFDSFAGQIPAAAPLPKTGARNNSDYDESLVHETRNQIRELVLEVEQLSRQNLPRPEYFAAFLDRVVSALAAVGGAIWLMTNSGELHCAYSVQFETLELNDHNEAMHRQLLQGTISGKKAMASPPRSQSSGAHDAGNPTDYLLLLSPVSDDSLPDALIEIIQRPGAGLVTQRGYLRFLAQMNQCLTTYLRTDRLRTLECASRQWERRDQFLRAIHAENGLMPTAFAVVNEGRLLADVDRATLAMVRGNRCELVAMSGIEKVEHRATGVQALRQLAELAMATKEVFWSQPNSQLSPQWETALEHWADKSPFQRIALLPLISEREQVLAVLILECLRDDSWPDEQQRTVRELADFTAPALRRAVAHDRVWLRGLWEQWATLREWLTGTRLALSTTIATLALAMLAGLFVLPWPLEITAPATLTPRERYEIFAPVDGTVVSVAVRHGDRVHRDDVLAELTSAEIDLELASLLGRQRTVREQWQASQRTLMENGKGGKPRMSAVDEQRLGGEITELKQTLANLEQELQLLQEKQRQLTIRAPHDGEVITWQVEQSLARRPVQTGQALMTLVDPTGPWELEVRLPERRLFHVNIAREHSPEPLPVRFMLASHPGQEFRGELKSVELTSHAHATEGNIVLARVAIETAELPPLQCDTAVTAQISCGTKSAAYVLGCDAWQALQTALFRWF